MNKAYKSKVDKSIVGMLFLGILGPIVPLLYIDFSLVAFCIVIILILCVLLLMYDIRYIIIP